MVAADAEPIWIEWRRKWPQTVAGIVQRDTLDEAENWLLRERMAETTLSWWREAMGIATRRRAAEHAEAREESELERVASCGSRG